VQGISAINIYNEIIQQNITESIRENKRTLQVQSVTSGTNDDQVGQCSSLHKVIQICVRGLTIINHPLRKNRHQKMRYRPAFVQ